MVRSSGRLSVIAGGSFREGRKQNNSFVTTTQRPAHTRRGKHSHAPAEGATTPQDCSPLESGRVEDSRQMSEQEYRVRECVHRARGAEGEYYRGSAYVKHLQSLGTSAA